MASPTPGRSRSVFVVQDGRQPSAFTVPALLRFLTHLGVPHRVLDIGTEDLPSAIAGAARPTVLLAHDFLVGRLGPSALAGLADAVGRGGGLVSLDSALGSAPAEFLALVGAASSTVEQTSAEGLAVRAQVDWVTAHRPEEEGVPLRRPIRTERLRLGPECVVLASTQVGDPAVWSRPVELGRVVQWATSSRIWSADTLGFTRGLDDLLWRSIVHVAPKPFALKQMRPFSRIRIDDCQGLLREPGDLDFVEAMNDSGHTPALCICLSTSEGAVGRRLAQLARDGRAELTPHVLAPMSSPFMASDGVPFTPRDLQKNFGVIDDWFDRHEAPMLAILSNHNHELDPSALPYLYQRGFAWTMNIAGVGERWEGVHRDWRPAPHGLMTYALESLPGTDLFAVFNHYSSFDDARIPMAEDRFMFERDGGYGAVQWDFLNGAADIEVAARRYAQHTRRGLQSGFFGGSLTHTHHMTRYGSADWRSVFERVAKINHCVVDEPAPYSRLARYAEAHARTRLVELTESEDGLQVQVQGRAALVPDIAVYTDDDPAPTWQPIADGALDDAVVARVGG